MTFLVPGDAAVLGGIQSLITPVLTRGLKIVSFIGSPEIWGFLFLVGAVLFFVRRRKTETIAMVLFGVGNLLTLILKHLIARPRPSGTEAVRLVSESNFSFPSGHALGAVIAAGALWWLWRTERLPHRLAAAIVLTPFAVLVGFSRIYLGVHWPSDVYAGYAVGLVWVVVVWLVLQRRLNRFPAATNPG